MTLCSIWRSVLVSVLYRETAEIPVTPLAEKTTGRCGVIFPFIPEDAFRFWPDMDTIRDTVSGN